MSSAIISSPSAIIASHLAFPPSYETVTLGEVRHGYYRPRNHLRGTASDWLPSSDAALRAISSECQAPGWDGQEGIAISVDLISTVSMIVDVLYRMVPAGTSPPDIVPESDGEISLTWTIDTNRMFSLSVGAHGKTNFAGQFGREGGVHGWKPLDASSQSALQTCLSEIARYLEKLYPEAAFRRAA